MNIYMAGPLFSLGERLFNARLVNELEGALPGTTFILPQVECKYLSVGEIASRCIKDIRRSQVVLACLDGADSDSGTCIEIAAASKFAIPVVGYRTDFRGAETAQGVNAMILHFVKFVDARSLHMTVPWLADTLIAAIKEVT